MKNLLLAAGLLSLASTPAVAQGRQPVIQFTGMVVSGDSLLGMPDARVTVPHTHRSTVTDRNGYFSLPVLAGDSIEVRAAYATTRLRVPFDCPSASYSRLVQLEPAGQPASGHLLPPASLSQRLLALKLPPSLTIQTPSVSTKALRPPKYDKMGRKIN